MCTFQFIHLFHESVSYFRTPLSSDCFTAQFFYLLFLATTTQFILNGLNLLLQEVFTLLLVNIFPCTHLYGLLDFGKLHFPIQYLQQTISTCPQCINTQQLNLLIFFQRKVRADKIHQEHRIRNILDGKCRILRKHIR